MLKIEDMTVEQKIGMVFCARKFGEEDIEFIIELIKNHALGCIQFPAGCDDIIHRILSAADYPILVFNDTEMGFPVSDLPKIPLMSLSACNNNEYYRAFAKGIVRDAKKNGFNGTWGPVIDILLRDGPNSVHRRFSDDPQKVAQCAEEIAKVFKQNHYLSTGKHYPGKGNRKSLGDGPSFDGHMTTVFSIATEQDITEYSLQPYMHLLEKDLLPCVMVGHDSYPNIDPEYPASLSKKIIDIIRNKGFDGVMFTDSFAMMSVLHKYGEENVYGMAIAAGNDIILPNYRTPVRESYGMLLQNFKDGMFSEERLNEAVRRVLAAQEFVSQTPEAPTEFTEHDEELLNNVARDCITAVTEDGVSAALDQIDNKDRLFVIVTENSDNQETGIPEEIDVARWYYPGEIAEKIRKEFPGAGIEFIPEFSGQKDNERVLLAAAHYKDVVCISFCTTTCYLGTDALTKRTEAVVNCLINSKKASTVVHFGNPYALKTILPVSRKIFGYMMTKSQLHAIDVLAGKIEAKGELPYDIYA